MTTIKELHEIATANAKAVADEMYKRYGDAYACGFAWVEVYGVKLSTKLGKEFKALGFDKSWNKGSIYLWNPSGYGGQNIDIKEQSAQAYAKVFKDAGYRAYVGSRLD
jgi:hypothetical protein